MGSMNIWKSRFTCTDGLVVHFGIPQPAPGCVQRGCSPSSPVDPDPALNVQHTMVLSIDTDKTLA